MDNNEESDPSRSKRQREYQNFSKAVTSSTFEEKNKNNPNDCIILDFTPSIGNSMGSDGSGPENQGSESEL